MGKLWIWIYEAVFQIGEAGFKLFVTTCAQAWCNQSMIKIRVQIIRESQEEFFASKVKPEIVLFFLSLVNGQGKAGTFSLIQVNQLCCFPC